MSEKYKFRDPMGVYFVTLTTIGWVDVFTRPELKHVVVKSLKHCQKEKGLLPSVDGVPMPEPLIVYDKTRQFPS